MLTATLEGRTGPPATGVTAQPAQVQGWMRRGAAPAAVETAHPVAKLWPRAQAGFLSLPFVNDSALNSV